MLRVTLFLGIAEPKPPGTGVIGANFDLSFECSEGSGFAGTFERLAVQGAPEPGLELPFHPGRATAGVEQAVSSDSDFQVFFHEERVILRPH